MADIPASNWSETDGSNTSAPPDGAPEGMAPSGVNDVLRAMAGAIKRWYDWMIPKATAGTTTAYTLSYSVAPGALVDGMPHRITFNATCGASPTLNVNTLGAKPIHKFSAGAWGVCAAGDLLINSTHLVCYNTADGTYRIVGSSADYFGSVSPANTIYASLLPQGRLTLTSATPVLSSSVTGATSIYYALYSGNLIPIYDGTSLKWTVFTELTNTTTDNTKNPAAVANNSNYDLFVWNDAGTVRLGRGPAWTSDTARGSGAGTTELQRFNGVWTNKIAITNGPAANKGTYVGTVRSDGSAQINWVPGDIGANGTAGLLGVWNMYNRVSVKGFIGDSTDSWDYSISTWRSAHASDTMRVSAVSGLAEDSFEAKYVSFFTSTGTSNAAGGIGYDSTSTASGLKQPGSSSVSVGFGDSHGEYGAQMLGFHYFQAVEICMTVTGTNSFYGDVGTAANFQSGLTYNWRA